MSVSISDLESRLSNYRSKLIQLDALIAGSSSNSFSDLRADVVKAISSTEERLVRQRVLESGGSRAAVAAVNAPAPMAAKAAMSHGSAACPFPVGTCVEAKTILATGAIVLNPCEVKMVRPDGQIDVAFIGSCSPNGQTNATVALASLSAIPQPAAPFPAGELRVGTAVLARYSDGNWYSAVVEAVLCAGSQARVKFSGYGNVEILPREYVQRPSAVSAAANPASETKASEIAAVSGKAESAPRAAFRVNGKAVCAAAIDSVSDAAEPAGASADALRDFVVPDSLKLLPTDTPDDINRKKRRISALKLAFKQKKAEALADSAASSWQNFRDAPLAGLKRKFV